MADILKSMGISDMIIAVSDLIDWKHTKLRDHNKRVAYISYMLAKELGLSPEEINIVGSAALIHDVGLLTYAEIDDVQAEARGNVQKHSLYAYEILKEMPLMSEIAEAILHHHTFYNSPNHEKASIASDIIHVADRIDILINNNMSILAQSADITLEVAEKMETQFNPQVVMAFINLSEKESFWLSATRPQKRRNYINMDYGRNLSEADKLKLLKCVMAIVDFRSGYTCTHSTGVTTVAVMLAQKLGMSDDEVKMIYVAGLLHDIGKISIAADILEKAGALSDDEFRVVRSHPYLTRIGLDRIPGFEQIGIWASRHHENLNGTGYPDKYEEEELPLGSLIMRVADVYTAITEDRPYRKGSSYNVALNKINAMLRAGEISDQIVTALEENIKEIDEARKVAQERINEQYTGFAGKLKAMS